MRGRLLKAAYGLRYHYLGAWPLDRWIIGLALIAAGILALLRLLPGDTGPMQWLPVALLGLLALLIWLLAEWARRAAYVSFQPAEAAVAPAGQAMPPADKLLIRATGQFEVEGKSHFFAHLLAYWRTFATREHAVMAIVHRSRFSLLGQMPERDLGMWYIFFCPEKIVSLTPGDVTFGAERRRALRVVYDTPEISDFERRQLPIWARRRKFSRRETVYLSFDDEAGRRQVWADLLADADSRAPQRE